MIKKKRSPAVVELSAWDTEFFGKNIARLTSSNITEELMNAALRECAAKHVDCLFARLGSDGQKNVQIAEKNSFGLMSTRASYEAGFSEGGEVSVPIRHARKADVPILKKMSRALSHESRFSRDPRFGPQAAERLYDAWIEKLLLKKDWPTEVLIATNKDKPVGFIAASIRDSVVHIDLIYVDPNFRGKSIGRSLMQACINGCLEKGHHAYRVSTQGSNVPAQRLYQSLGFRITSMELDYHKWFT